MSNIRLIHGDTYKEIRKIADKSVDVVYTDPPYEYDSDFGKRLLNEGKILKETQEHIESMSCGINKTLLDELVRVMRYIYIYIWCNDKQIAEYMDYFVNKRNCDYKVLVWCKDNPMPMYSKRMLDDVEYCLLFVEKGKPKFMGTDKYTNSFRAYKEPININDKKKYKHSSIKPLQCVINHLEKSCSKGMTVLDCFMGSGTTMVACKELGLNGIGIEIDKKYYDIAVDRLNGINQKGEIDLLSETYEQMQLFTE